MGREVEMTLNYVPSGEMESMAIGGSALHSVKALRIVTSGGYST